MAEESLFNRDRQAYIRHLIETGVELNVSTRKELAQKFGCKTTDIANEIYRIKNPHYWHKHRATHQVASQNGRARSRGIEGYIDPDDWRSLCEAYDNMCACCKKEKPLVIDHILPVSGGGTNTIENIQPLCSDCKAKKSDTYADYRSPEAQRRFASARKRRISSTSENNGK